MKQKGLVIFVALVFIFILVHQIIFYLYPIEIKGSVHTTRCPIGTIDRSRLRESLETEGIRNTGLPQEKTCVSYVRYTIMKISNY